MTVLHVIETSELVLQLRAKRKYAYSVLYDKYAKALLGVAIKMVQNPAVGEDVLQEVFVKIWRHIDSYDSSRGTLFTWMLNITRNMCKDYLRSKQYLSQQQVLSNELESVEYSKSTWQVNHSEEGQHLNYLTQKLGVRYREIIDLIYIYGYTQEEVAKMLNIPLGTVKTRCRSALQQLRSIYNI